MRKSLATRSRSRWRSRRGKAAPSITLKLPLTLAIIDGLLVKIGSASFILPLSFVDECVELTERQIADAHGRHLANIRGEIVPYIRLRERFGINGSRPAIEQIVTTRVEDRRVGLVVDQVVGEHQTVIKPLGRIYRHVEESSGATILGDGRVALIIDIPKLIQKAEKEELSDGHIIRGVTRGKGGLHKNNHERCEEALCLTM